ncbi:hypothetical protein [Paracoccus liaowanqingii]|uniref:hypothetical protein n=1 Tax=Paracoccus liaowanqingii TaxID=2560053 RepID=UPI00143D5E14|nr:hypothetical protein [Paracoccus liaowanqingii]
MKLAERNRLSPFAARTASVIAMRVPPMQYPLTVTVSLFVIFRATSLASRGPRGKLVENPGPSLFELHRDETPFWPRIILHRLFIDY